MRAPSYEPQTNAPQGPQTRFDAPDRSGVGAGIARGLQGLARGVDQYAQAELAIQERHNDITSRQLALEWRKQIQPMLAQYQTLKGANAVAEAENMRAQIAKTREEYAERAGNQRMREMFSMRTDEQLVEYDGVIVSHGLKEQVQSEIDTNKAELSEAQTMIARNPFDKKVLAENLSVIAAVSSDLSTLAGDDDAAAEDRLRSANTVAVSTAIAGMLKAPNVDLGQVISFYEEHKDMLSAAGIAEIEGVLAEPRQNRADDAELENLFSGVSSSSADAGAGGGVASSAPASPATTAPRQTPVAGRETSDFAAHQKRGSAGYDIVAPAGSAIKPVAEGVVEEVGTGKTGGNFIRIRHPDGTLTSYMHMGAPAAFKRGDRVTRSTVIGTVGSTGRATGPHLHLEVKDAKGRQIDPEEYLKGSSPVGSPSEPRLWNEAAVLAEINRKEDAGKYTPEQADRLRTRFARRVKADQDVISLREAGAVDGISQWLIENGDTFTDLSQMPAELRANLSPERLLAYANMAQANAAAQAPDKVAGGAVKAVIEGMAITDPEAFIGADLTAYAGVMTPPQIAELQQKQIKMRDERDQGVLDFEPGLKIKTTISAMSSAEGTTLTTGQQGNIAVLMEQFISKRFKAQGGKELGDADYMDAYRYATQKVSGTSDRGIDNFFMGGETEAERYKFTKTVERATAEVEADRSARQQARAQNAEIREARSRFGSRYGRPPSQQELNIILEEVRKERARGY